jgi:cell wall-associated NlpC family hydrolase
MEGSNEGSYLTHLKRLFIILPILLTHSTINAEITIEDYPTPSTTKSNFTTALPIFANTLATYNNLKTLSPNASLEDKVTALSKESRMTDRRQMVAWFAESHTDLGFHYRYGGTSLQSGIDCSGFTRYVLNYFDYKAGRSSRDQYDEGRRLPVAEAKAGDLVFFGGRTINHVAIIVSNDKNALVVVHSTNRGIIKENIYESKYWKSKLKDMAVNIIDGKNDNQIILATK